MKSYSDFSLEEKIGQMLMIGFHGKELDGNVIDDQIGEVKPGGFWLTDNDTPMGKTFGNIESPDQVKKLVSSLKDASETPPFISIDAEGGRVIRLKEKFGFPGTVSAKYLGDKNDPELTFKEYEKIALLLKELGINFNFAPVVDLELNKENPPLAKKERCFGETLELVISHAEQMIKSHVKHDILYVLKHFPGHGSSGDDSHDDLVSVSGSWQEKELEPYKYFIKNNMADAVLSAHIILDRYDDKYPGTLSRTLLTDLLRTEMGFSGIIVSDDLNMGAVAKNYEYQDALVLAINAGIDIIMQGNVMNYQADLPVITKNLILEAVRAGRITEGRINDSFQRIISTKLQYGIIRG